MARAARLPCAVCDGTNETTRLCRRCLSDPANAGWNGRRWRLADKSQSEAVTLRWADMFIAPPPLLSDLDRQIVGLLYRDLRLRHRVRVRQNGVRVWTWGPHRRRALRFREIAFLLDCPEVSVRKIYRYVTGL